MLCELLMSALYFFSAVQMLHDIVLYKCNVDIDIIMHWQSVVNALLIKSSVAICITAS